MKYIIEHMEPELYEWCIIEYKHISEIVGKDNLIITNINEKDVGKLNGLGEIKTDSVNELSLGKACILDANADKELSNEDFEYLVFGGILGDYPPKKRTSKLNLKNAERRNLGKNQFPTDNAVYVAKQIIDGKKLGDLEFIDHIEIELNDGESVQLPFRYVVVNGKPLVSKELIEHLKKKDSF